MTSTQSFLPDAQGFVALPVGERADGAANARSVAAGEYGPSRALGDAHRHLAEGRIHAAAESYRVALEGERGTRVSALLGLTLIARRGGQTAQALRLAQAALELDPASGVGWASYGSLLQALGQWNDAQAAYQRALALPAATVAAFLPALTGLGEVMLATRRAAAALACFRRALLLEPQSPVALHGLGAALARMEQFAPALECFRALIALAPEHADGLFAAGFCAAKLSRHREAIGCYEGAIRLRPGFAAAWGNMAVCLVADGRDYLAVPCFAQALAAEPKLVSALLNFGNLLRLRKAFPQARGCYERALDVDGRCVDVMVAMSYLELEASAETARFARAEAWLDRAAEAEPTHSEVANGRGILALARHSASGGQRHLEDAIAAFRQAAARGHRTADSNVGNALLRVGRVEEAIAAHARSVALDPLHAGARYNLALSQLRAGWMAEGWRNYEARLDFRDVHPRPRRFQQPRWRGEPLAGTRLFVHYEQGLGDTIQFARFLPLLARSGARLVVEVQPPLVRLLRPEIERLGGVCLAAGESIPAFDWHVPLLSLPWIFGTTLETVPPPLELSVEQATDECAASGGPRRPRIGICWAGNPRYAADRERSTRLESFLPLLLAHPDEEWVSLQKGAAAEQIADVRARLPTGFPLLDASSAERDLADTAVVVARLDRVITTDTVIAHLAATMGKSCWVLLPWQGDWRWMQEIEHTPWYGTMRLFRQAAPGDWAGVMERVSGELHAQSV